MQMKKFLAAAGAALLLTASLPAVAASPATLSVNGVAQGAEAMASVWNDTTYVSLRAASTALDSGARVSWENGSAWVRTGSLTISAQPGNDYLTVNGQKLAAPQGVRLVQGCTLVPVRALAQAFGFSVYWNPLTKTASLHGPVSGQTPKEDSDLYWLARIISAESRGEPLEGQIAVGNVVLNRVADSEFPDTIYDVIFDDRWGGQFEPVRNGTIYDEPAEQSVLAARLCLEGADVVGDSLYFLAPALAQNFWTAENREYVTVIGCHEFYK